MGLFPQIESNATVIEKCTKCYVSGLICADTEVGGAEDGGTYYYSKDSDNLFCEQTKGTPM